MGNQIINNQLRSEIGLFNIGYMGPDTGQHLDDSNYFHWSFCMETFLKHKRLWEVNTVERPEEAV